MKKEQVHTLILGAGPSGLTAGYTLAKANMKPVLLERAKFAGGLMCSLRHGDFIMDVGRKELYSRLEKVDNFYHELLKDDFRPYDHRGGVLYKGHIIDARPNWQGFRRGMPWGMFFGCALGLLWARLKPGKKSPTNLEEFFHQQRGRRMTEVFSQGFQEKLIGKKWRDVEITMDAAEEGQSGFFSTMKAVISRAFSKTEPNTFEDNWHHPVRGTGQICEMVQEKIESSGGRIEFGITITGMTASDTGIETVTVEKGDETIIYEPEHVISSIPVEFMLKLLKPQAQDGGGGGKPPARRGPRNTVVLVYLFLDEPPRFPQVYLHVTCPSTRIGRLTNYSGYNGDMVPEGKTCLCCEYYCFGEDELLALSDEEIGQRALHECAEAKLVDPSKSIGSKVLRLPGADASQNRDNWMNRERLQLMEQLAPLKNLYSVNRTEIDIAMLAGMEAVEAILGGDRSDFDRRVDPAELNIRSESKAFEFRLPAANK